ncbi:MAG: class II fructose-bisphosphatase [Alphaproteobacteria bacterium]|uniref:Fructose-1,6-bisphosphatase n=1 Tax=PS1 clade bacterium TaxID=2175152 RepID=A0A368DML6_9PROT|nr:fructose-bisphosphatase class II [Rhodobiaceae bacterium]OUT74383.1 MAG: fructose-bisphosphatase class II [Rhizobiales bacterium TMED25]RCL73072.1 MAG: class II fructose-bisphosphatase [PS1 clade bacterium]
MDRALTLEIVRVTESAAIAAAKMRGRGDEKSADQAAVDAMRRQLNMINMSGTVVIGEGERDEAPMLFIGEKVGTGNGPKLDIALDPLEGTTLCAKAMPNSLAVLAISENKGMLNAPDTYMDKIAIGPGYTDGVINLDASPAENIIALSKEKGVSPDQISACILDRSRHSKHIESVRSVGASVYLIQDGDVAGVIATTNPNETNIDIYMGIGGAPEGVLAAAALKCIGGQMQSRLVINNADEERRAKKMGIENLDKVYTLNELVSKDVIFSASGVTDGSMVKGVNFMDGKVSVETIVMRSTNGTIRYINTEYNSSI